MAKNLPSPNSLVSPKQPIFAYDIKKAWEKVVEEGPIWVSKKFPPLPKEKKYTFLGKKLISPIIIAAGSSSGKKWSDFFFKMGFGGVIQKTMRTVPRASNKVPNVAIVEIDHPIERKELGKPLTATKNPKDFKKYLSITNSFGNPSPDMITWGNTLRQQVKGKSEGQILGCSVTATTSEKSDSCMVLLGENAPAALIIETASDLLSAACTAATSGADFIELNLACPNVTENPEEGEMFQNAKLVNYTLTRFKRMFPNVPIGFKFGIYKSKEQMKKIFASGGENLDYISGINAVPATVTAKDGSDILPGRRTSGVAGKADQIIALEHIEWAAKVRKELGLKYEILGCGGVVETKDVDRFLAAGADAVQVATIALVDPLFAYKYYLNHLRR